MMRPMRALMGILVLLAAMLAAGCPAPPPPPARPSLELDLLPVQQMRAYPEAVTRRFVALVDLEDHQDLPADRQAGWFRVEPADGDAAPPQLAMNVTRTGLHSLAVALPVGAKLVLDIPDLRDFTPYTLVSLALHSPVPRDDLRVRLDSASGSWTSPPQLIRPGWNTVLVDLAQARRAAGFDPRRVLRLALGFDSAGGVVGFYLDDVLLIDNRRALEGSPPDMRIEVSGLDWHIHLPGADKPVSLLQGPDGLWRLTDQALLRLGASDRQGGDIGGESLSAMGDRWIGARELLECNPIRLRLASTWYAPSRAGEWLSLAVRQVRWEHTIYADGRRVTHVELNNAGGGDIGSLALRCPAPVAWADGEVSDVRLVQPFLGPIWRSSFLGPWESAPQDDAQYLSYKRVKQYQSPGRLEVQGGKASYASGDSERDGFDESQGCYSITPGAGSVRLVFTPPPGGIVDPVVMLGGRWSGPVTVSVAGKVVRRVVRLDAGSLLMVLPGRYDRPTPLEVTGRLAGQAVR